MPPVRQRAVPANMTMKSVPLAIIGMSHLCLQRSLEQNRAITLVRTARRVYRYQDRGPASCIWAGAVRSCGNHGQSVYLFAGSLRESGFPYRVAPDVPQHLLGDSLPTRAGV